MLNLLREEESAKIRNTKEAQRAMAGADSQKQLFTLIRDFASEKSQGERRVVGLKKRIEELRSELDAGNLELEGAKRHKETTEQELRGYEVQLALSEASIQALEARISQIQNEIAIVGSEVEAVKNEDGAKRDEFIRLMFEVNAKIRKFQESIAQEFQLQNDIGTVEEVQNCTTDRPIEVPLMALENMIADIISETNKEKEEYLQEQKVQKQAQLELCDLERKISMIEEIVKETKALQDLTRQTSELEQTCALLGEELQKRCICPHCHLDNVENLSGIPQTNEVN
ncbi:uncharacterized protein LOC120010214 [Tripterygium wilfordii]|uniref:uncharacterized protein LOC120010214 n=1 Tax=Tripterygium wilfordii TaxID=458696 RepID=UPI0018F830EA|nr:uncharacterized protein LOC120010214 [Tripterygium wilfordii]